MRDLRFSHLFEVFWVVTPCNEVWDNKVSEYHAASITLKMETASPKIRYLATTLHDVTTQ